MVRVFKWLIMIIWFKIVLISSWVDAIYILTMIINVNKEFVSENKECLWVKGIKIKINNDVVPGSFNFFENVDVILSNCGQKFT